MRLDLSTKFNDAIKVWTSSLLQIINYLFPVALFVLVVTKDSSEV